MKLMIYFFAEARWLEPDKICEVGTVNDESWDLRKSLENYAMEVLIWLHDHPNGRTELKWAQ
jgi:proteasome lid subunit RPN8/RPN11